MYAIGKIPAALDTEGRSAEGAVSASRRGPSHLTNYSLKVCNDVQVVATVMSVDHDNAPAIAAMTELGGAHDIDALQWSHWGVRVDELMASTS